MRLMLGDDGLREFPLNSVSQLVLGRYEIFTVLATAIARPKAIIHSRDIV